MGGEMPVTYMTLRAYAKDYGIEGDDFRVFRKMFDVLDTEWLKQQAEKAKKDKPDGG